MTVSTSERISSPLPDNTAVSYFAPLALTALISTILLIMVGAIVRVTGNGLGCPDWPLCHGQAIPPFVLSAWVEFIHRLFGAAVVLQVAALIVIALRHFKAQKWIYRTAVFASGILVVQIVLGGIHVIYELPKWTGWVHTAVAMLVAGVVAVWVALSRPSLQKLSRRTAVLHQNTRLPLWTAIAATATYILLLTGSLVTRSGASLVCRSFPYCGLPTIPDYLQPLVLIQMTHRYSAYIVAITITLVMWHLIRTRQDPGLRKFALALAGLLTLQFSLGMTNVWFAIPMWSRILHLGTGATIWVVMVLLTTTLYRGRASVQV